MSGPHFVVALWLTATLMGFLPQAIGNSASTTTKASFGFVNETVLTVGEFEDEVSLCVEVTLLNGETALGDDVILTLSVMNQTAFMGIDFDLTDTELTFAMNSTNDTLECIDIMIQQDDALESNETFTISVDFSSPVSNYTIDNATETIAITITDNSMVAVTVPNMESTCEGDDVARVCVVLLASANTERDFQVTLSTINGTAVDSMDFMVLSVDLTFSSGSGNGTEQCVNSTITDDMYSEILDGGRGESFAVILTSSDPDVMVKNNQTLISILDNDGNFSTIVISPLSPFQVVGGDITLECSISHPDNETLTTIRWSSDLSNVNTSNQTTDRGGSAANLNIVDVNSNYCGTFTCTASDLRVCQSSSLSASVDIVPSIYTSPTNVSAPADMEVTFSCVVNAGVGGTVTIMWSGPPDARLPPPYNTRQPSPQDHRVRSELTVNITNETFEGGYRCSARFDNCVGNVTSDVGFLSITPPPEIIKGPENQLVDRNSNVSLNCTATNVGNISISWTGPVSGLEGDETLSDTDNFISIVTVMEVDFENGGEYVCTASNEAGSVNSTAIIYVRPELTPVEVLTSAGMMVTLMCVVQDSPPGSVRWQKMNMLGLYDELTDETDRNLTFQPVAFGDEGSYRCVVNTSEFGELTSPVSVITVAPEANLTADSINQTLARGDNITLTCSGVGGPDNIYQWQFSGQDIDDETSTELDISNVNASNGGDYSCVVSNAAGNSTITTSLFISSYFTSQPESIGGANGSSVTLTCMAEAFPAPEYQWRRIDAMPLSSNVMGEDSSMLEFDPLVFGDEGNYFCLATSRGTVIQSDNATVSIAPEANLTADSINQTLAQGDNITLTCSGVGGPDNLYQWQFNGHDIYDETFTELDISNVNASDGGEYSCVVSNAAGNSTITTSLFISPYFTSQPESIGGANGSSVTLTCVAEAFPALEYQWRRIDAMPLSSNVMGEDSSMLKFDPLVFGDEGGYFCLATSRGTVIQSDNATVSIAPGEVVIMGDNIAQQGDNVTFNCSSDGGPANTFQWLINDVAVMGETSVTYTVVEAEAENGGVYTCRISNAAGNSSSSITLFIEPYITQFPPNITLTNSGALVTLLCDADGFPAPNISWVKVSDIGVDETVSNSGNLTLSPITHNDFGMYRCIASAVTPGGMDLQDATSPTSTIIVSPEGSVSVSPMVFNGRIGEKIELTCNALGSADNTFTWTRVLDGEMVGNESMINVTIGSGAEGGEYECRVRNDAGMDAVNLTINVAPRIIESPNNTNVSISENITLSCVVDGVPIPLITWFQNGSAIDDSRDNQTNIITTSDTRLQQVQSTLIISMAMVNDSGVYHCNVSSSITEYPTITSEEAIALVQNTPEQPQNVMEIDVTSREVNLTWVEPHDNNAPILGYLVRYMEPDFVGGDLARVVNTSVEMATITDLSPGVDYEFTVTAYNLIGSSSPSDTLTVRTLDEVPNSAPGNVTASALNSTSIMVRWEVLPPADRNGIIAVYEVMYQPMETFGDAIGTEMRNVSGLETSVVLDGLEEFVNYTISVQAYTSVGPGPASEQVTARTNEDAPSGSPVNVTALANSSTSIMVTWGPVPFRDQNGIITEYEVMYEPLETFGGSISTLTVNVSDPDLSTLLMELQEFVNYSISVRAYTIIGPGPYSDEEMARTNEDVPARPPVNTTATVLSSTSIMVTWDPVPDIDQNGIITEYEVMYEPLETFNNTIGIDMVTVRAPNTSVLLNGLQEYVNYSIRVRASTSVGPSDYSSPVQERTNEDVPRIPPTNVAINTVSSTSIMVTWGPVPDIDQNGVITEYEVMYEPLETFGGNISTQRMNVTVPEMSVTLTKLQEFVFYNISVRAYTSVGAGPFSEDMTERTDDDTPSSSPVNVTALVNSSTSIMVTWGPVPAIDQNGIITEYEVMYEPLETFGGSISTLTVNVSDPDLSTLLMELQEFVNYSISVRAYTIIGPGPYSDEEMARTNEDVPARPPVNTTATVLSSTSIMVTWGPVPDIDQNGVITEYEVMYEPLETFNNTIGIDMVTVRAPNTSVLLNGLQEYVNYSIRVRASTSVGPSDYSSPVQERTNEDVPRIPPTNVAVNTASSTSIMVTWGPVPAIDQNGIITEYEVMYEPLETFGGNITTQRMNVTVPEMSVTLTKLQEFVFYNISVRAYTSVGAGPFSEDMTERTDDDTPSSSPVNVTALVNSSTSIMVTWGPVPAIDQNGIITEYEVMYEPLETFSGSISTLTVNVSDPDLSTLLMELQEFVNYSVSVRAYTIIGPGPYSDEEMARTNEDVPARPPVNTTATVLSSTSIMVTWGPVPDIDQNGIITEYEVMYEPLETFNNTIGIDMVTVRAPNTSVLLNGLQEYVNYSIRVRAFTSVGPSDYSSPVQERTNEDVPRIPPTNVAVNTVSSTSIMVTWGPVPAIDQNGIITEYEVMYEPLETFGGNITTQRMNVTALEMSVTLTELQEFVFYNISVRAYTSVGAGPFSEEMTERTNEDVPSGFPQNVTASNLSSTVVMVTWEEVPLIDQNGVITMYEVLLEPPEGQNSMVVSRNFSELSGNVTEVEEAVQYNISVRAYTMEGPGPYSTPPVQVMTNEDLPGPVPEPPEVPVNTINATSAVISWDPPSDANGVITLYTVNLVVVSSDASTFDSTLSQGRRRKRETSVDMMVSEECIKGGENNADRNITVDGNQTSLSLRDLTPYSVYEFRVQAFTRIGPGSFSPPRRFRTSELEPSGVTNLTAIALTSSSIRVMWGRPQCPYGNITRYIVHYRLSDVIQTENIDSSGYTNVRVTALRHTISNLTAFKNYTIHVQAVVTPDIVMGPDLLGQIDREVLVRTLSTTDDVPTVGPTSIPVDSPTSREITHLIGDPQDIDTGRVILCAVVVVVGLANADTTVYDNARPFSSNIPYYIAAGWGEQKVYAGRVPSRLRVGDGSTYRVGSIEYKNVPLDSNTQYSIFTRYDIRNDIEAEPLRIYSSPTVVKTELPYNEAGLAIGILIIIAVIALIIVLIILLYYKRDRISWDIFKKIFKKKGLGYEISDAEGAFIPMNVLENPALPPIPRFYGSIKPFPVKEFKDHVKKNHSNDDYLFSEEYSNVEPVDGNKTSEATHSHYNTAKNRYANIPAYDHSRVLLTEIPGQPGSDYINANYIDGYNRRKQFIATQGPVPDSVPDFWRMVWEQNSVIIVMLTNLEERGRLKCHQYWPKDKSGLYGSVRVHLQEEVILADYTIRTFSVQHEGHKTEKIVTQYHFTVWPDHGVPDYPTSLLLFVRRVTAANYDSASPIIVHCSAGVGRTGTFITLFTQLQRIKEENNVDIFNFVQSMRYNRCCMVQTEHQYIFLHDALLEAIECGVTEVPAREVLNQYRTLGVLDNEIGLTRLEIEYDKLDSTIHRRPTKTFGTLNINKAKNRYANIDMIPYDTSRIRLNFIPGVEGSDYINASFIDGYLNRRAYIATQGPLPDTSEDFWRMVWEQKCATIVMLTKDKEGGRTKCHKYWPTTGAEAFGQFQVILHGSSEYPDYILREFKIVDTKDESSLPVKQFQSSTWPEEGVPDSSSGLIDLIGQVQKWQMSSGNKPIAVHCSGGTGRTGTFIAVSILLERLKTEGVVDVFHSVRALRLQRPGMVQTVDQYEFCYKSVLEYLESFELYDNFK